MIEIFRKWILRKRNPCKKCLVGVMCSTKMKCEEWDKYLKFEKKLDKLIDKMADIILLEIVVISLAVVGITFILGLYQWGQILLIPIRKWLF